jgi:hypothetical protein
VNAEIVGVEEEIVGVIFADDLKAVVLRHTDTDERPIERVADVLPVGGVLPLAKVDANEWHGLFSTVGSNRSPVTGPRAIVCICLHL